MALATIRDVAREAGASVATVSRVLNGMENVAAPLRARVLAAAAALNYTPHAGARNLSRSRHDTIGVVLPDLHGEFFSEILRGMDREASSRGLHLLLSNMQAVTDGAVDTLHTMRGRVDGLIIMAPDAAPERLLRGVPPTIPAVLVNCAENTLGRAEIRVDNAGAAAAMTNHLIATGRTRIAHLSGPDHNVEAQQRVTGYRTAVTRAGLEPQVITGDFTEEAGIVAANAILRDPQSVDALFCGNDMMAIGALGMLRRAGVDVPGRIAVAGFDDVPLARLITPGLTTMRVDIAEIGARAVARLADAIAGGKDAAVEVRRPQLVVRETTAARKGFVLQIDNDNKKGTRL